MRKMLLVFSHKLTDEQIRDANETLKVTKFVSLPEELQRLWMNITPDLESIKDGLNPICKWIQENAKNDDYVLIQGDFGATCFVVYFTFKAGKVPIYATTERQVIESKLDDNVIKTERVFRHKRFRKYEMGC